MVGFNTTKRCCTALLATALSCGIVFANPCVSYAVGSYDSRDVNRNGVVDITDVLKLNRYLLGVDYMANTAALDVDGNSILSPVDSNCIIAGTINNSFYNIVHGISKQFGYYTTSEMGTSTQSLSQSFTSYDLSTASTETYQLSLYESNSRSSTETRMGIIGQDTRVADSLESIVSISNSGTGFIVGDHVIATAAHCVYDTGTDQWISNLSAYLPDANGQATTTSLTVVESHIPTAFINNHSTIYDFALITVEEDLSDYYHFNLGIPYNIYSNADFERYTIYSTGYSQFIPDGTENSYPTPQMYTGRGKIVKGNTIPQNVFCHNADITHGNSGGPIYVKESYKVGDNPETMSLTVISICTHMMNNGDYNKGPIMNPIMIKFFKNNSHISY